MRDATKTKAQLIEELSILRHRIAGLKAAETKRKQVEEEWRSRNARLGTLIDVTQKLSQGLDLPFMLQVIAESAAQLFDGEVGFRLLEGEFLIRVGVTPGARKAMVRERLRLGESLAGRVAVGGRAMTTSDSSADDRLVAEHRAAAHAPRVGSLMCLPIQLGKRMLGTLHFFKDRGYHFSKEDLDLGMRLANHAAIAISNAQLYTERKVTEEALQESEARYRALVEQSLVGIYIIQDGQYRYVNPKFAEIFGYTPEEIIKTLRSGNELISDRDRARVQANIQKRQRGEAENLHYTFQGRRKDEALIDVEIYGSTMTYEGKPAVIGVLLDITQRKRTERVLQDSEKRYRTLIEGSIQGISISRQGVHLFVNKALATMLGYREAAELVGRSIWDHVASHELERLRSYYEARLRGESAPSRYEFQAHKTDGVPLWIERQISSVMWGSEIAYLGTYIDITERKQAEQGLRQTQTQLRALATRYLSAQEEERQRIARDLHDILGQNLTALKLDLLWVERRLPGNQDDVRQKMAQMAELTDHMGDTIGEIVTALRPAILDHLGLAAAIEGHADKFQKRTGIVVMVACDENVTQALPVDQSLALFRIYQEALTNVARHSAATMVAVRLTTEPGQLHLEVWDNGCGISDDAAGSPQSLGLLGMRERVLPWGGEVHIYGKPGQGTVVNIDLPWGNTLRGEEGFNL